MASGDSTMGHAAVTAFICVTCRGRDGDPDQRPGRQLFDAVIAALQDRAGCAITVTPVECLSVCKRPGTVALSAAGKWTYVVGDLNHHDHVDDIIATAMRYAATGDGIIPWRERPQSFRKGVISRIPPLGFRPDGG
jgi:predicted metal-binding protein